MSDDMDNIIALAAHQQAQHNQILITEDSVALEFAERYRGGLLFDHDMGRWFRWTGTYWQPEGTKLAFDLARTLARELTENEEAKVKALAGKTSFASGVERSSQAARPFAVTSQDWDTDLFLLGTPGGTVELRTGKLRNADPGDRITKITSVAPADVATCPRWLAEVAPIV